ncbi:J domain-containing protein [Lysobacter fragariae]
MNPFACLGVPGDADETTIKRAYARLLKQHRPDEDPQGFQRLHEAYTQCLAWARHRASFEDDFDEYEDGEAEAEAGTGARPMSSGHLPAPDDNAAGPKQFPGDAGEPRDAHEQAHSTTGDDPPDRVERELMQLANAHSAPASATPFVIDTFVDELLQRVREPAPRALSDWLHGHEALYSLQLKQTLREPVAQALAQARPLPGAKQIHVAMEFFGLEGVTRADGHVAYVVQQLFQRIEDAAAFDRIVAHYQSPQVKPVDRMLLRELTTRRNWFRFLLILLCPLLPTRTRSLLLALEEQGRDATEERLNHQAANFWRRAADADRLDWRRVLVALTRIPLVTFPLVALVDLGDTNEVVAASYVVTFLNGCVTWLLYAGSSVGWRWFKRLNERTLRWDLPLAFSLGALGTCVPLVFALPGWTIAITILVTVFWNARRSGGTLYCAFISAVLGAAAVASLCAPLVSSADWGLTMLAGSALYGAGSTVAVDVLNARKGGTTISEARDQLVGWHGWACLGHAIALLVILVVRSQLT